MLLDTTATTTSFCYDTREIWVFVGQIVNIFKIVIPVILIVIGVVALGKAVIADDDKEIKTAVTKLIKKVIVAVIIFFVPAIVKAIFNLIDYDAKTEATKCINYLVDRDKDLVY